MVKVYKPTSPGRRGMTGYDFSNLTKVKPLKKLTKGFKRDQGRNNQGRITTRHKGGGVKRRYREIDFKMNKINIPARVFSIEYDPNRTARVALLCYADGEKRYMLAPDGLKEGDSIEISDKTPIKPGNRMKLNNIPQGTQIFNIEYFPEKGGQIAKSAGSFATVMSKDGGFVQVQMPSSEIRKVSGEAMASIGRVSNIEHSSINIGKAGRNRKLGIRPTVRGSAMNPVDHPYGGGEGRVGRGTRRPKTAQGKVTGGRRTRNKKKKSSKFILKRRKSKK